MTPELLSEYRDYAWKYFSMHADHRLRAFNFFVVFATFLIGAFGALVARKGIEAYYCLIPLALVYLSFVFWKLEERTRMLVKNGEDALKLVDSECLKDEQSRFDCLALFAADDAATSSLRKHPFWAGHFSYSRCFRWVYLAAGVIGIGGVGLCVAWT